MSTETTRIRRRLTELDFAPWHRCHGLLVWRKNPWEYKLAWPTGECIGGAFGLDEAVQFIMKAGI